MSWNENSKSECNNPACRKEIWWNPKVLHPNTGRMRPLSSPYHPDSNPNPDLHLCMKNKRPGRFISKYGEQDPEAFIKDISYSKELYDFLKRRVIRPFGIYSHVRY